MGVREGTKKFVEHLITGGINPTNMIKCSGNNSVNRLWVNPGGSLNCPFFLIGENTAGGGGDLIATEMRGVPG